MKRVVEIQPHHKQVALEARRIATTNTVYAANCINIRMKFSTVHSFKLAAEVQRGRRNTAKTNHGIMKELIIGSQCSSASGG